TNLVVAEIFDPGNAQTVHFATPRLHALPHQDGGPARCRGPRGDRLASTEDGVLVLVSLELETLPVDRALVLTRVRSVSNLIPDHDVARAGDASDQGAAPLFATATTSDEGVVRLRPREKRRFGPHDVLGPAPDPDRASAETISTRHVTPQGGEPIAPVDDHDCFVGPTLIGISTKK